MLLKETPIGDVLVTERIKIKTIDFVAEKNGGYAGETIPSKNQPDSPTPPEPEPVPEPSSSEKIGTRKSAEESMFRKFVLEQSHWIVIFGGVLIFFIVLAIMRKRS